MFHGRVQGPSLPPGHSRHVMEIWPVPTKTTASSQVCAAGFCWQSCTTEACAGMQPCSLPKQDSPAALGALQLPKEDRQAFLSLMSQMSSQGFAEHRGLSRELAGPWNRWRVVNPPSKTAGGWPRAHGSKSIDLSAVRTEGCQLST